MNTKQLIKEINEGCVLAKIERKEIIDLLKRGEEYKTENIILKKFEKMWKELKFDYVCNKGWCEAEDINEIEQKYFPKEGD